MNLLKYLGSVSLLGFRDCCLGFRGSCVRTRVYAWLRLVCGMAITKPYRHGLLQYCYTEQATV